MSACADAAQNMLACDLQDLFLVLKSDHYQSCYQTSVTVVGASSHSIVVEFIRNAAESL